MKYIDVEKLKVHIEAKMVTLWDKLPDADKEHPTDIELRDLGMYMALEGLIEDLDSLQQEQLSRPDNLDDVAEEWAKNEAYGKSDTEFEMAYKGFKAGAKWQKEQMMKEAVEADVNTYRDLAAGKSWAEFVVKMPTNNLSDKVRIIIVKENKK